MKLYFNLLVLFTFIGTSFSQESSLSFRNFETDFFTYEPKQKTGVSDDHFSYAKFVIDETKLALKNDVNNYTAVHYWNIITALDKLDVDHTILIFAFQKMFEKEDGCEYILNYKGKASFYDSISTLYDFYYSDCKKNKQ